MDNNTYNPPLLFANGHIQTIFPVLFRKVSTDIYTRERINTEDDDFLDLDWSCVNSNQIAIISHGLEGDSHRAYVTGMARAVNAGGWDALAWNYRGCSGEPNRRLRSYHNGSTEDLACVISHAAKTGKYKTIALIGFSLGGNLTLVHLGRERETIDPLVQKAVVFSVPCDIKASAQALTKNINKIYMKRFLIMLHDKIKAKSSFMPEKINDNGYRRIKNFKQFDDRYTAPIHGFKNAEDYWSKCSSKQFIPDIRIPTVIINAKNDPFLSPSCFPVDEVSANHNVNLETPDSGGHVGFIQFNRERLYWSEKRAVMFLNGSNE